MPGPFYFSDMKKTGFVITVLFVCTLAGIFAQKRDNKEYIQWIKEAQRLYDLAEPSEKTDSAALHLFLKAAAKALAAGDYPQAADCYIKAGNIHQTYQRFAESAKNYHLSLQINTKHQNDKKINYEAFLYLGSSFYFSNVIDSAQYYFELASDIASSHSGKKLPEEERLYNSLGAIYFESANYLQAKNYFEKALLVTPPDTEDYEESLVGINSNIANCLLRLNQYDSALRIYRLLLQYKMPDEISEIIKQNTAHTYFELGRYDSALALYQQLPFKNPLNSVKALNDIGRIFMERRQWQQAEAVFDSAIAVNRRISANIKNKEEAKAYLYRGQLAAKQGLTDEAITWCNEALQEIHLDFTWKKSEDLPEQIAQTVSPITLFEILQSKAAFLFEKYRLTGEREVLIAALNSYIKAIETADFIKLNFDNDESKLFFNTNYKSIYSEALRVAYECCQISEDFFDQYIFILESYKGTILYQNLLNVDIKSLAKIPASVKKREKEIKQLLAFYTSRINNNAAEKDAGQLQKRLLELQVELSRLQKEYENDESYNLYKNQSAKVISSLAFVQSSANKETAYLNYYISDSAVYLLAVTRKKAMVKKVVVDSLFTQNFSGFYKETYKYEEGKRYEGSAASAYLYQKLISPVEQLISTQNKWIIIPDGFLYYLPFEALVSDTDAGKLVVERHVVSYHYSFSLLLQKNTHHFDEKEDRNFFAVTPFAERDANISASGLAYLPFSKDEVSTSAQSILSNQKATKQNFVQKASQFSLIHLATHASTGADSAANWIQFYPSDSNFLNHRLFVPEIYNLDLHRCELVILSACETAGGASLSGEGLLSLSRAFLYAGSDGIISTLWRTEDQVTSYLMQRLHTYLKKDMAPENALQLAKLDLLKSKNISAKYKTPNYWSNFIYVGKVSMNQERSIGYWRIGIAVFILAALFFLLKKRSKALRR